jgi:hypothetical protein
LDRAPQTVMLADAQRAQAPVRSAAQGGRGIGGDGRWPAKQGLLPTAPVLDPNRP